MLDINSKMGAEIQFPLREFDAVIEALLDFRSALDGDPDLEPNGDELDGQNSEDEFMRHSLWTGGPGCPVSDPDAAVDDSPCDPHSEDGL